jgi:hypothetical protein
VKKLTPGRRGEKRKRPLKQQMEEDEEKRRRAGKILSDGGTGAGAAPVFPLSTSGSSKGDVVKATAIIPDAGQTSSDIPEIIAVDDEDIFGNVNRIEDIGANQPTTAKPRSATKSECETKNKAVSSIISRISTKTKGVYSPSRSACSHRWRLGIAVGVMQSSRTSSPSRTRACRLPW